MNYIFLYSLISFIIGACFGSFLSVAVHRSLHRQKGIITGKSRCPNCKHQLRSLDLIPLLSWIFKGGQCSYCKKPISPIYPSLELTSGLLFLANFNMVFDRTFDFSTPASFDLFFWIKILYLNLITLNLLAIFFSDLQKKIIPNLFLYSLIILSLPAIFLAQGNLSDLIFDRIYALMLGLFFFGGQYWISRGKWLGSGDIYVAIGMALLLGFPKMALAIILAYLIGSFLAIVLLITKRVNSKQSIPFAPFLILGTFISLYLGNQLINWYFTNFLYL